jgi:hypothetical protein
MDQAIATTLVVLVLGIGGLALFEPLIVVIKSIFTYLRQIFLGPIKKEKIHD